MKNITARLALLATTLIASSFLLADPPAAEPTQDTPGAVYFMPPPNWYLADTTGIGTYTDIMVVGKGKSVFPPSMTLTSESYEGTLKEYLKLVKAINERKGSVWKDLGKIKTSAGEGNLSQVDWKSNWGEVRQLHMIILQDGIAYILAAAALKEEYPSYYREFFNSMQTFHINPRAP